MTVVLIRHGECNRCGACCLRDRCPALGIAQDGRPGCTQYETRPMSCRASPRNPQELMPGCGYWFEVIEDGVVIRELRPPVVGA